MFLVGHIAITTDRFSGILKLFGIEKMCCETEMFTISRLPQKLRTWHEYYATFESM